MRSLSARSYPFVIGFCLLLGAAFWLRVSSLESMPSHNGDESYEGLETARMLRGERFSIFVPSGNLISPFFTALRLPFQIAFKPSLWTLRAPSVISGVLSILLVYILGARVLGRTAALIATALLATVPP